MRRPSQTHSLLLARMNSWISEPVGLEQLERFLHCIRKLQDLNNFQNSDLTIPVLIYTERFVKKNGILPKEKLFLLLLVATVVSIKMLEEEGSRWADLRLCAQAIGIGLKDLGRLEKELIIGIEWSLHVTAEEWSDFAEDVDYVPTRR